jgi:hypothetical protein
VWRWAKSSSLRFVTLLASHPLIFSSSAIKGQLQGIPEILRHNRKSLRVNRNKAITILCAFAVSVAPDVIDAIATTLPGKKKAKVR